ncbi:hypothetical protein [Aliagarivorans taiwanensis]|uniref:hypothetical protein n=1 Tax=Aliagarivorans taiwanensis TaxID=561966 RepID=UPI00055994DF|nr:hypothetical protein [Aliagarivorans taiwanensis]
MELQALFGVRHRVTIDYHSLCFLLGIEATADRSALTLLLTQCASEYSFDVVTINGMTIYQLERVGESSLDFSAWVERPSAEQLHAWQACMEESGGVTQPLVDEFHRVAEQGQWYQEFAFSDLMFMLASWPMTRFHRFTPFHRGLERRGIAQQIHVESSCEPVRSELDFDAWPAKPSMSLWVQYCAARSTRGLQTNQAVVDMLRKPLWAGYKNEGFAVDDMFRSALDSGDVNFTDLSESLASHVKGGGDSGARSSSLMVDSLVVAYRTAYPNLSYTIRSVGKADYIDSWKSFIDANGISSDLIERTRQALLSTSLTTELSHTEVFLLGLGVDDIARWVQDANSYSANAVQKAVKAQLGRGVGVDKRSLGRWATALLQHCLDNGLSSTVSEPVEAVDGEPKQTDPAAGGANQASPELVEDYLDSIKRALGKKPPVKK